MAKKSKGGKIIPLQQTPQNYIRTRGRSLPVDKCYALENWQKKGMTPVIVSRKHVTGNVTFGMYLIDLWCLGIKDTFYTFNTEAEELLELVAEGELEEIDYVTAHNIVYGSEAYADELGFKPHKDWALTQYILEPDEEQIPLIDIEFGKNGEPFFVAGPDDTPQMTEQIMKTLQRNAGYGNFGFATEDEEDQDEYDDAEEGLLDLATLERIVSGEEEPTLYQQFKLCIVGVIGSGIALPDPELDMERLASELVSLGGNGIFTEDKALDIELDEFIIENMEVLESEEEGAIIDINALLEENPDNPYLYLKAYSYHERYGESDEAAAIGDLMRERYPDFLLFDFTAAILVCDDGRAEEGASRLKAPYLSEAFPGRTAFAYGEALHFYAAWCACFMAKGALSEAIIYANLIVESEGEFPLVDDVIFRLCEKMSLLFENENPG